jgi:hypothetical protein
MMQDLIRHIQGQFQTARLVELPTREPFKLRRNLYEAAKRRGLKWRFARTSRSVIVTYIRE